MSVISKQEEELEAIGSIGDNDYLSIWGLKLPHLWGGVLIY